MSETLSLPAPAKLNLNLRVTGRRADGMHLLHGTIVLIDFSDMVHLTPRTDGKIVRNWQHAEVAEENDITLTAARQLQKTAGCHRSGVTIRIDKHIPVGSGLGGGSSNAATVLIGLNRLWQLDWQKNKLLHIAASLGADIPFFFHGCPAIIAGIGNTFSPVKIDINNYLLVFPPVTVMTAAVYEKYARLTNGQKIDRIPPPLEKSENDLTAATVSLYPHIMKVAQVLYDITGEARLSGSGATVFAAFADKAQAQQAQRRLPATLQSAVAAMLPRHPLS